MAPRCKENVGRVCDLPVLVIEDGREVECVFSHESLEIAKAWFLHVVNQSIACEVVGEML